MKVLVVGLGAVGSALLEILEGIHDAVGYDIKNKAVLSTQKVDVLHICFPYTETFVENVVNYMRKTNPKLVLIESTVLPGTTRKIHEILPHTRLCHSPVRGRHATGLKLGFLNYTKFIGGADNESGRLARDYYEWLGFKTRVCCGPEETEFAKLFNLSYFAVMLAWNQEMRRISRDYDLHFSDVEAFLETNTIESDQKFPRPIYDGKPIFSQCIIHGVCLLQQKVNSKLLWGVLESNERSHKK